MKKLFAAILMLFVLVAPAWAGTQRTTLIDSTTLDADPTSASGSANVQGAERIGFFVSYDETEVGGISVAITAQISYDGSTWLAASFYDYAGGATLQTSESLTGDANYYFWFPRDLVVPYVKVIITATGSDADDTAIVGCKMITSQ